MSADNRTTETQRLALARSVWRAGTPVLFIGVRNESLGWEASLPDAVRSGRAFALEVRKDILALDGDRPDAKRAIDEVARRLAADGIEPVIVASGQPGRFHLFAKVPRRSLCAWYAEVGIEHGLDWRNGSQLIRPPLGVHRLGPSCAPTLVSPKRIEWAMQALQAVKKQDLPPRIRQLLRAGDVEGVYGTARSGVEQAVLTSMMQRGWTFDDAIEALSDEQNRAGEKFRDRNRAAGRGARAYLVAGWENARQFVRSNPAFCDDKEAVEQIQAVIAAIRERPWPGHAGATDRAVMLGLADIAAKTAQIVVSASNRQLAEMIGRQQHGTVGASLNRLNGKWIRRESAGRGRNASSYRMLPPPSWSGDAPLTTSAYQGGCEISGVSNLAAHDAFRHGGLPKSCARIYEGLAEQVHETPSELAARIVLHVTTIRKNLLRLEAVGMAQRDAYGRWRRLPVDLARLDEIAEELGTAGKAAAQHVRFDEERVWYTGRHPRSPTRFVCLPSRGVGGEKA